MKKYIYIIIIIAVIGLVGTVGILGRKYKTLTEQYNISKSNEKALLLQCDTAQESVRVLQLTVDQLDYFKDSLLIAMNNTRKELGVRDKNLKALQLLYSTMSKTDTIVFTDTIFKTPKIDIDSVIGDAWYTARIRLVYPNTIIANPKFISKKYITLYQRRETVNPPKKFFLLRWFQKKHTIVEATVIEKNPYIKDSINQFIEILK